MEIPNPDLISLFITWTTYGAWLPGDSRGWRKWKAGEQQPQPWLQDWCKQRMKEEPVVLDVIQRRTVEEVITRHAKHREWELHAVSARSNHVHVALSLIPKVSKSANRFSDGIKRVRDEFKANATRVLRQLETPIQNDKIWTKGGDIQVIDSLEGLYRVVLYVSEAQDRMDRLDIERTGG